MASRVFRVFGANLGTKIISILFAVVLWVIAIGSRVVEENIDVPLEVITSNDIVPANELPPTVTFRVQGPKAFLRTIFDARDQVIRVNLANEKPRLASVRFSLDSLRVPLGVKVLRAEPPGVMVKLEYVKRKEVPVRLELRGLPSEGYRIAKAELKPAMVRIKGAESRVEAVTEVATVPVDISDIHKSIEKTVTLELERHSVQLDGLAPKLWVEVDPIAANFRVRNVDIRVKTTFQYKVEEKSVTVLVRADQESIRSLDKSKVYGRVDLSDRPKGKHKVKVEVVAPPSVTVVKVIPEDVTITLY